MRKANFVKLLNIIAAILSIITATSSGQTLQRQWSDGDPVFLKTIKGLNVYLKDLATLEPQYAVSGEDELLDYRLYGLEWKWPSRINLTSAQDIDSRVVGDQTLYLVTDALARRVFEINAKTENETWTFPPSQNASDPTDPKYLNKPMDAFIFRNDSTGYFKVVITDQDRNRVITIDKESSKIDWWYGDPLGIDGNGFNQLRTPEDAEKIVNTNEYIIADKGNNRVIIVEPVNNTIVWELGDDVLESPVDIQYLLPENHILITDQGNHRVIIVDRASKAILWQFGQTGIIGSGSDGLKLPTDADYIAATKTVLIADNGNNRLIEVDQSRQIVWQFHRPLIGLRDVDRIADGRTLVVRENYPERLAYVDSLLVSNIYDLGENKESIFDSLRWSADTTTGVTSVWLQLRSANSLGDLEGATWYGPTSISDFYQHSGMPVHPAHRGHRFYQFRAYLKTKNPLQTPTLHGVYLKYHYYRIEPLENAYLYTPDIKDAAGFVVVRWKKLEFKTILPSDAVKKDKINLEIVVYNGVTRQPLERFVASKVNELNTINLEDFSSLNRVQKIYLVAYLSTLNSSVTPILDNWQVSWEAMPSANSKIHFADFKGNRKEFYRSTQVLPPNEKYVDSLYINLKDPDLQALQTTHFVQVRSLKSKDSIQIGLTVSSKDSLFKSRATPILISSSADPFNQIMEAQDRDTLVVMYQDEYDASDQASDSILVIKNTVGTMTIENKRGVSLTKTWFGDTLFVRVRGEYDHNIAATKRDSIHIQIYDRSTGDEENVTLYELSSGAGKWDTGEFISANGFRVVEDNNGEVDNGQIETMRGHKIKAEYIDNVILSQQVLVPSKNDTVDNSGDNPIYFGNEPYVVDVAPNPYYYQSNKPFRMRIASKNGTLKVHRLEIYNLAGEKVHEISGSSIRYDDYGEGATIPREKYGYITGWWGLENKNQQRVSSGTYWVKVYAQIEMGSDINEQVSFYKKFIIIR